MAQKKAGGSSKNGRDSKSKRLGIKIHNNNFVKKGSIIVRQNGTKFYPGKNTLICNNFTIQSLIDGIISYKKNNNKIFINVKCF
ncbi:ribosomal protein L27 [Candidatus Carsonella ruddii CS isolate Thao2000]|uniref:Large ribosomal subunit protein bL27 n=1 Tax=Candidatus Carsonella ruddii CS isolate Thao2000 TaxID=1202537 RepID=J7H0G9_CARRU|nr:50S ribosomal protein L27 [Candidatus Carsonella ruddii]AFP83805.1 ribosomal protein L27 [Candidatus Carsonella ruddii CS isolate Thao2000]